MKIRAAVSPMKRMKARKMFFASTLAVTMGITMMAPSVLAMKQASQAQVPFGFTANGHVFPAGKYRVVMEGDNHLTVASTDTGRVAGFTVRTTRNLLPQAKNSLVFRHNEQGYQLISVRFGSGNLQTESAVQSKRPRSEREVAKNTAGTLSEVGMR